MDKRLWRFGQQLPVENKFHAILKLELLRKSLGDWETIDTDEHNKMCRKCHIPWTDGFFNVEVVPGCKRSRMQIEKLQCKDKLTKQQQSLVKYLKTRTGRVAKYTCQICSYKTRIPLDPKVKWPTPKASTSAVADSEEGAEFKEIYNQWLKEKQRKRKRDKIEKAGLKIPTKLNNQNNKSVKGVRTTPANTPSSANNRHTPADFKLIQQYLKNSLSGEANNKGKAKPKANQPVGKLRYSRS
ncbi:uncharacterized protein LOC126565356 [Anopheles maculipalpis]|uniref:uncharacterized protein LOC126565356 n=1 Tax=Anopheles maculipalpis TaxID=1496333 RepID=UPI002158C206|nr:uncharacterized protein LOC126565356 [Anopheles maculipalpis]